MWPPICLCIHDFAIIEVSQKPQFDRDFGHIGNTALCEARASFVAAYGGGSGREEAAYAALAVRADDVIIGPEHGQQLRGRRYVSLCVTPACHGTSCWAVSLCVTPACRGTSCWTVSLCVTPAVAEPAVAHGCIF